MDTWHDVSRAIQAHPAGAWLHEHLSRPPPKAERVRLRVGSSSYPGGGAYILCPPASEGAWHLGLADCLEVARAVLADARAGVQIRLAYDEGKASMLVSSPTFTVPADGPVGGQLLSIGDLSGAVAPVLPSMPQLPGVMPPEYVMALERERLAIERTGREHAFTVTGLQVARESLDDERSHARALLQTFLDTAAREKAELMKLLGATMELNGKLSMGQTGGLAEAWKKAHEALERSADARVEAAKAEAAASASTVTEGEAVQLATLDTLKEALPLLAVILGKRGKKPPPKKKEEPKAAADQAADQAGAAPPPPPAADPPPGEGEQEEAPVVPGDIVHGLLAPLLDEADEQHQEVRAEFVAGLARLELGQLVRLGQLLQSLALEGR
jgi:hypothetical protein